MYCEKMNLTLGIGTNNKEKNGVVHIEDGKIMGYCGV